MLGSYYWYFIGIFLTFFALRMCAQDQPWTWLHQKNFGVYEQARNSGRKELIFRKANIKPFSQLVFSWNAFRPKRGHFSFFVQSHNQRTKTWGPWHKMVDWGLAIQRSYSSGASGKQQYLYVRLETGDQLSDAFCIKIVSNGGADLSLVKGLSVNVADFSKFKPELLTNHTMLLPSIYIRGVPRVSQFLVRHPNNDALCSPTACSMVTYFVRNEPVDVAQFAHNVFDQGLQQYGSWPFNTAHAFEACAGACRFVTARIHSFKGLHEQLCKGMPVVVSVRGKLSGAPKVYDNGHLLVVVGWDKNNKQIITHDPAARSTQAVLKKYPIKSFLAAWERSRRLAYIAQPVNLF
ncbi:C39 family peptidase [Candidatus Dependentiae bacterium]|nr:C39 family peptidase [Candidatus Dependentiae bacterium]